MAESHVLVALRIRRADLANYIRGMTEALAHLDATITLLEQGVAPSLNSTIYKSHFAGLSCLCKP